ncbi:MAG: cytochrome c [Flavobacteriales bacterium]|nr:cytochrome c [Flavobacteriales bacterium]MBK9537203.1 cytochrome c [Flavobacteriales bacterium]
MSSLKHSHLGLSPKRERTVTFAITALFVLAILLMLALPACKHEPLVVPQDDTAGGPGPQVPVPCDSGTVYFQQQILPLLISSCGVPSETGNCHFEANDENDWIDLMSYGSLVQSGIIQNGDLVEAINETDPDKIMPRPGFGTLSDDQIEQIELWIAQGYQNNSCANFCDTTAVVTYSGVIQPIIQQKCLNCHSGANPQGSLNFSTWAVVSAKALDGSLPDAIQHANGAIAMPPFGAQLPQCEIDHFLTWIQQGAPNN